MKQMTAAPDSSGERLRIFQRAFDELDAQPREVSPVAARAHQNPNAMTGCQQCARDRGSDKTGTSGDEAQGW